LNEERTVYQVVQACLDYADDVLVVDGGSEDRTCEVAASNGARVACLGRRGKGLAVQYAIDTEDAEILVFIDADGSHCPADIPMLLDPIISGEAELVIACRFTGGSDELENDGGHFVRSLGTRALHALVNACLRVDLTDIQNGFRAIRTDVARDLDLREPGFCIEQEMAIKCLRKGYRVINVPSYEYRRLYGKSRLCLWRVAPRCIWNAAVLLMGSIPSNTVNSRLGCCGVRRQG